MGFAHFLFGPWTGYLSPSAGLKFADVPNGLAAISKAPTDVVAFRKGFRQLTQPTSQVPPGGWTQILLYMGWCEVSRGPGGDWVDMEMEIIGYVWQKCSKRGSFKGTCAIHDDLHDME